MEEETTTSRKVYFVGDKESPYYSGLLQMLRQEYEVFEYFEQVGNQEAMKSFMSMMESITNSDFCLLEIKAPCAPWILPIIFGTEKKFYLLCESSKTPFYVLKSPFYSEEIMITFESHLDIIEMLKKRVENI